jgi:hypothetical protein
MASTGMLQALMPALRIQNEINIRSLPPVGL